MPYVRETGVHLSRIPHKGGVLYAAGMGWGCLMKNVNAVSRAQRNRRRFEQRTWERIKKKIRLVSDADRRIEAEDLPVWKCNAWYKKSLDAESDKAQ